MRWREKRFVRLVGDDPARTILACDLAAGDPGADGRPLGTFRTPTLWVDADDFAVEGLTIANTAGDTGQAVAVRVDGDRVAFRNCRLHGWQDTLLCNRGRHYFERCTITGAIDFIFGGGTAFFESCDLVCAGDGYVTAPSTRPGAAFGFVFARCRIAGRTPEVRTYLGRPWRAFAAAIFVDCTMDAVVRPAGWNNWDRVERERTARFAEAGSRGAGAAPAGRAGWARLLTPEAAAALTAARVLGGPDHWAPAGAERR